MDLWEDLIRHGWQAVVDLCANAAEEGQILEFKRKQDPKTVDLTRDDRKSLGESLSAFSNATGGVIIFGIEDKKGEDGIDRAEKSQPLHHAVAFANKLKSLIPEYISPPHSGIEVRPVLIDDRSKAGIVAIHVTKFEPTSSHELELPTTANIS